MEIAGIRLQDNYSLGGESLSLNGAAIRSKFFVKVYVGALYLGSATRSAAQALSASGAKSMQMVMLFKEVEAKKITTGWDEGFRNNLSDSEFRQMADRLEQFNALFPALRQGDHVFMNHIPGKGTELRINNTRRGHIDGDDFFTALMKVWLGEEPADKDLKKGLLGN